MPNERDRYLGCLLGLACGDAVGTTVEFEPRGAFAPITGMAGGGPFELEPGQWTDDTSMALCLAQSLVERRCFDPFHQMDRYCDWVENGYMSSKGWCFDVGNTVHHALDSYRETGAAYAGSTDPYSAGNGSIMRLAPIPMFYACSLAKTIHYSAESSRTTHQAPDAVDSARLFGAQIRLALVGASKEAVLREHGYKPEESKVQAVAAGAYRNKSESEVHGSGYVVESLEAALWCFHTTDSFEEAVLRAANLGDDADTTAAVVGQLAGAHYGVEAIPGEWLECLAMRADISELALRLLELREA